MTSPTKQQIHSISTWYNTKTNEPGEDNKLKNVHQTDLLIKSPGWAACRAPWVEVSSISCGEGPKGRISSASGLTGGGLKEDQAVGACSASTASSCPTSAAGTGEGATTAGDEGACLKMASVPSSELEHSPPRMSGIGSTALPSGCSPTLTAPCEERTGAALAPRRPAPLTGHTGATGESRSSPLATRMSTDGMEEL